MKKFKREWKRMAAIALAVLIVSNTIDISVFAVSASEETQVASCEHHTEHTEDCGYSEGAVGSPCIHEHGEECYTKTVECIHNHDESCGYSEAQEGSSCTHEHDEACGEEGAECIHKEHTSDCGYAKAQEESPCTHECSEEGGCVIVTENCIHTEHDETCGYVDAVEGTSCNYVCELCVEENKEEQPENEPPVCICTEKCVEETVNAECPVCNAEDADVTACVGTTEILTECTCGTDDDSIHATDCPVYAAPENPVCSCAEKCTADTLNVWCDVCGVQGVEACEGADTAVISYADKPEQDENGVYQISTADQLYWFADQANNFDRSINGRLTANITLPDVAAGEGSNWTPIGLYDQYNLFTGYTGTFDGDGHTVSNIQILNVADFEVGLFGINSGTIRNVGVIESNINGDDAGGVCGDNRGTLENCYNTGAVSGNANGGGVCGYNRGTITNCYNTGVVLSTANGGGVCGQNRGTLENCYNTGEVSGAGNGGGVCGYNRDGGTLENCYNTGEVSGAGNVGGVCGDNNDSTITNCYYLSDKEADDGGKTSEQFASGEVAYLLNGSKSEGDLVWYHTLGTDAYPLFEGAIVYYDEKQGYCNHVHTWKYTVNGSNITATCKASDCTNTNGGSVSIAEPASLTYTGSAIEADVTDTRTIVDEVTIVYTATGGGLTDGKPVNAGNYTASITLGEGENAVTASVNFEIEKATLNVARTEAEGREYDGTNIVTITAIHLNGILNNDEVSVQTTGLTGTLNSANAGTYTSVTLPNLSLTGTAAGNYTLEQPSGAVPTTVEISIAENVLNMPGITMNVSNKYTKIGDVPLPTGWEWQDTDKETSLEVDIPVTATAVYTGADKDNYINVTVQITVTRNACDHVAGSILYTGEGEKAPTCTEGGLGHTECKECGTVMESGIVVKALGHTGGTATCSSKAVCARCKQPYGSTDGSKHDSTEVRGYVAATCTSGGYTGDTYCKDCGSSLSSGTSTGATGHDYAGVVTKEPTTEETGTRTYTCSDCGHTYTEPIEKTESGVADGEDGTGTDTEAPFIKDDEGKEGWDVIRGELDDTRDGDTVTVDMNGSTVVPGDVFNDIKGKDVTVVFDMGNGITWSVNGKDITSDNVGDIDFSVKVGADANNTIPVEIINKVTGERYYMNISLAYDGEFGFKAVMTLNVDAKNAGLIANLFYFNEQTGEMELICADEIAEDGTAELTFTHASEYTVIIDKEAMGAATSSDTSDVSSPLVFGSDDDGSAWWIILLIAILAVAGVVVFVIYSKKKKEEE